jgi:hypothetical protein
MVFWTALVPDSDVRVNVAAGTAELHVHDLPELDYYSPAGTGDLASLGPTWQSGYFASTVSFDAVWSGPVTRTVNVKDTANGFAGHFKENQATVTWSAQSTSGFNFTSNAGNFSTSEPNIDGAIPNHFAQVGHERNGVFFPSGAALQPDPLNPARSDLVIDGSSTGGVHIQVDSVHGGQDVRVKIDGANQDYQADFPTPAIWRVVINSGPGNNHIEVANDIQEPTVILGSYGDDHIEGGGGRTIIIGGLGSDHLEAGTGGTILIAGVTDFNRNLPALDALLTEWARTDESYLQRVANLSNSTVNGVSPHGGQNGGNFLTDATVHDDGSGNALDGGPALDWFFANRDGTGNNGVADRVRHLRPGEIVTPIFM